MGGIYSGGENGIRSHLGGAQTSVLFYILLILSCYTYCFKINKYIYLLISNCNRWSSRAECTSQPVSRPPGYMKSFICKLLVGLDMPPPRAGRTTRPTECGRNKSNLAIQGRGIIIFPRKGHHAEKLCKNIWGRPQ